MGHRLHQGLQRKFPVTTESNTNKKARLLTRFFTLSKETPKKCWRVPDRVHFCLGAYDHALIPNPEENGRELELNLAFI